MAWRVRATGCTAAGVVMSYRPRWSEFRCLPDLGSHDRGRFEEGDGWPQIASGPHLCTLADEC
jgi:hypothetical protein